MRALDPEFREATQPTPQGPTDWDVVVVGAGPAGCAAAYDLAAAGRRVLLVDKATFPRAKACAGGLTLKAVRALRYPVDPVVCRWERRMVLEESSHRAITLGRSTPVCAMTVREEFDRYCLRQTLARGVAWQQIGPIEAMEQDEMGVTLRVADSAPLRARYVLGADGVHSQVRTLLGPAPWLRKAFALEMNVPYRGGEDYPVTFDFEPVAGGYGWLFPRNDHVNVGLYAETVAGRNQRLDAAALGRYVALRCGEGREGSHPVGQFLGLGAAAYWPEPGTRVLLAGDAAGFVDPLTGEGIYGAIRSGQMAAEAMKAALLPGSLRAGSTRPGLGQLFCDYVKPLRADLRVAEHAARRFYAEPAVGFNLLRLPLVAGLVLRMYGEGMPLGWLLRAVRVAERLGPLGRRVRNGRAGG